MGIEKEYGPFHRFQNAEENELMCASGLVGGRVPRNIAAGLFPRVKAYEGPLPQGRSGIEFYTDVSPDDDIPHAPTWTIGREGVIWGDDPEVVLITARIVKRVD